MFNPVSTAITAVAGPIVGGAANAVTQNIPGMVLGAAGVYAAQAAMEKYNSWIKTRTPQDKAKIDKLKLIYNRRLQKSFEEKSVSTIVHYKIESADYPFKDNPLLRSFHVQERVAQICKINQELLASTKGIFEDKSKAPPPEMELPENIILEEMKDWLISLTHISVFSEEVEKEIENRLGYIRDIISLGSKNNQWVDGFIDCLQTNLYDFVKMILDAVKKNIARNKFHDLLDKINKNSNGIVTKFMYLLYKLSDLDVIEWTTLTPEACLVNRETLEKNFHGKLLLCLVTDPHFRKFRPPVIQKDIEPVKIGVVESASLSPYNQAYIRLFNVMSSLINFFLVCKSYKDFREIGGNLLMSQRIRNLEGATLLANVETVIDEMRRVFDEVLNNFDKLNSDILEAKRRRSSGAFGFFTEIGDDTPELIKSNSILKAHLKIVYFDEILSLLSTCRVCLYDIANRAIDDHEELKNLEESNQEIMRYIADFKGSVAMFNAPRAAPPVIAAAEAEPLLQLPSAPASAVPKAEPGASSKEEEVAAEPPAKKPSNRHTRRRK